MGEASTSRVFIVVPSLATGGAERMVVNLCRGLDRRAWQPIVVTFTPENDFADEMPPDVPHLVLGKAARLGNVKLAWRLARVFKQEQPDLVFSRVHFATSTAFLARALSRRNVPLVAAVDTTLSISLRHERYGWLRKAFTRLFFPHVDRLIPVSARVEADLVHGFGIPPGKCVIVPNSVDRKRIETLMVEEPQHPWFGAPEPVIAAVGRLTKAKNYPLLLQAFADLLASRPARLVIVGEGEERDRLRALAEELGVRDDVAFLGSQPNPFKFIGAASVFVLSSDWEGFGNVLIEAMACGTPVVSTRYGEGAEEIITDGVNGLLVPCGDRRALADAMLRAMEDERLRARLSENGRRRALDFDNEAITRRYEVVFRAAVERRG